MKITDTMVEKFCREYHDHDGDVDCDVVRLVLESVFAHIELLDEEEARKPKKETLLEFMLQFGNMNLNPLKHKRGRKQIIFRSLRWPERSVSHL